MSFIAWIPPYVQTADLAPFARTDLPVVTYGGERDGSKGVPPPALAGGAGAEHIAHGTDRPGMAVRPASAVYVVAITVVYQPVFYSSPMFGLSGADTD